MTPRESADRGVPRNETGGSNDGARDTALIFAVLPNVNGTAASGTPSRGVVACCDSCKIPATMASPSARVRGDTSSLKRLGGGRSIAKYTEAEARNVSGPCQDHTLCQARRSVGFIASIIVATHPVTSRSAAASWGSLPQAIKQLLQVTVVSHGRAPQSRAAAAAAGVHMLAQEQRQQQQPLQTWQW